MLRAQVYSPALIVDKEGATSAAKRVNLGTRSRTEYL